MPEDAQITFVPGELPEGACPQNEQERMNLFADFLSGFLPGSYSTFNIGTSQPTVDNQDKPWIKLNSDGSLVGVFTFSGGSWIRPHSIPPATNSYRAIWVGSLATLATFDGGDAGVITDRTGAWWEEDTALRDMIPRGATATVPVGTAASELSSGASATDQVYGVYFIKRTARVYYVG